MRKKLIKMTAVALILMLVATTGVFASVPEDVKGQSYENAVSTLVEKLIITGDTDGKFYPDSNLTRAQACVIVVKSMNPPSSEVNGTATQPVGKSGFSDMSGYGWAEGYIKYAVDHGVTKGYPDKTFKPGNKVTINEFITMVLRAADYTDESLGGTWPTNYLNKAAELELLKNLPSPLPVYATKWMAAQLNYNALSRIEAANPQEENQESKVGKQSGIPDIKSMTYGSGSFDSSMSNYNGKPISNNAVIYTYGQKKNYSSSMTFSDKVADYDIDTAFKYKNVKTPAFYKLVNGKIKEMVVPKDVGFSGKVYGVINDTISTVNRSGEAVKGLVTLTAAREITWLGEKGLTIVPTSVQYLKGEIYELNLSDGEIKSIYTASNSGKKGKLFEEISGTISVDLFDDVEWIRDGVVKITDAHGGAMFSVKDNATIYVMDRADQTKYKTGRISSIKDGVAVRAYDISDDDDASADIVVVLK